MLSQAKTKRFLLQNDPNCEMLCYFCFQKRYELRRAIDLIPKTSSQAMLLLCQWIPSEIFRHPRNFSAGIYQNFTAFGTPRFSRKLSKSRFHTWIESKYHRFIFIGIVKTLLGNMVLDSGRSLFSARSAFEYNSNKLCDSFSAGTPVKAVWALWPGYGVARHPSVIQNLIWSARF